MSARRRHGRGKQGMADWSSASWAVWEGVSSVSPSDDEMRKNSRGQAGIHPAGHGHGMPRMAVRFAAAASTMPLADVYRDGGVESSGWRLRVQISLLQPPYQGWLCTLVYAALRRRCRRRRCLTDASKSPRELHAHRIVVYSVRHQQNNGLAGRGKDVFLAAG
jgi:hypothetical protein